MEKTKKRSPWAWIPTLYFAQGIPYFAVNTISVLMFKRLGMSNADIALYTGWLYLPWVIKPFWSPFVDIIKTKRWWTVIMQIIVAVALAGVALTLPSPEVTKDILAGVEVTDATAAPVSSFIFALAIFWVMAFASATHDIASDGYYMLALNTNEQSLFERRLCCVRIKKKVKRVTSRNNHTRRSIYEQTGNRHNNLYRS